jgi:hypothetical protein
LLFRSDCRRIRGSVAQGRVTFPAVLACSKEVVMRRRPFLLGLLLLLGPALVAGAAVPGGGGGERETSHTQ